MSLCRNGSLDITQEMLQEHLDKGVSFESKAEIEKILSSVCRLSNIEKLLLYLKLPTHVPVINTPAENVRGHHALETVAVTWIKTHLARNEKTSLHRQKVYDDYRSFCDDHRYEAVSLVEFKKILLSIFPDLTSRRLGKRGNAKHMFGGISYQVQPTSFTLPKLNVDSGAENTLTKKSTCLDDEEDNDGERTNESDRWTQSTTEAANRLVLEWAYKLLNIRFQNIRDLAGHLLSQNYVSHVSLEAFSLATATNCDLLCRDSSNDDSTEKQRHARHQLQKKLQERCKISRQKQRMEEERNQLSSQDAGSVIGKRAPQQPFLPGFRNPTPTVVPQTLKSGGDVERNLRRPTILPKTLLPKPAGAGGPAARPVFSIDLSPRTVRRVDQPQFIFLPSQNTSHFQPCTPGSLVLISNAPTTSSVPAPELQMALPSIRSVGPSQPVSAGLLSVPKDLSRTGSNGLRLPVVPVDSSVAGGIESNVTSKTCSGNTSLIGMLADTTVNEDNDQKTESWRISKPNRSHGKGCSGDTELTRGSLTMEGTLNSQEQSVTHRNLSKENPFSQPPASNPGEHPSNVRPLSSSLAESEETENPAVNDRTLTAKSSAKDIISGSKGRGRSGPSRSATKTVSSILEEQRCNTTGMSRALYNDSRSVSQILKELRGKKTSGDLCEVGSVDVSELSQADSSNTFVGKPVFGLTSSNIQFVKFMPEPDLQSSTEKGNPDVQSAAAIQRQSVQSSSSLQIQAGQSAAGLQMQGIALEQDFRLNVIADVLSLKSPAYHVTNPSVTSSLVAESTKTSKAAPRRRSDTNFSCLDQGLFGPLTCETKTATLVVKSEVDATHVVGHHDDQCPPIPVPLLSSSSGVASRRRPSGELRRSVMSSSVMSSSDMSSSVMSSSVESKILGLSDCFNLQQLLIRPTHCATKIVPSHIVSPRVTTKENSNSVPTANKNTTPSWQSSDHSSRTLNPQGSGKRTATTESYSGIKRILIGDEQPKAMIERNPYLAYGDSSSYKYYSEEATHMLDSSKSQVEVLTDRIVHSPGDLLEVPYKNTFVQHCTLQQLSNLQQSKSDPLGTFGSRPSSAFGTDKTSLGFVVQPSRPYTVAAVWDEQSLDLETDILPTFVDSGRGPCRSVESCNSEASTPLSIQSPRSNLSCCSMYLEQTTAFMPLRIADTLPSVAAIKPLPKLGQRHRLAVDPENSAKRENSKSSAVTLTTAVGSFVPYASLDSWRIVTNSRSAAGFAPVSSIRPLKKTCGQATPSSQRQRHHSAHEVQDSTNKVPQNLQVSNIPVAFGPLPLPLEMPVFASVPGVPEQSAFSSVGLASGGSTLVRLPTGSVLNLADLETGGEVDEIISASQDLVLGGASMPITNRSQSEPANGLQTCYPFDIDDVFGAVLNSDMMPDPSANTGNPESPRARTPMVSWSEPSTLRLEKKRSIQSANKGTWSGFTRGDHMISGIALQPSLSFPDGDLTATEYVSYRNPALPGAFVLGGCSPPHSQDPSPEFGGEIALFDKADKGLEGFTPEGTHSTALDTPNSLVGIFSAICGEDSEGQNQSGNCNMDFGWPYFQN